MSANGTRRRGASAPGAALLALWLALPPCALAAEPPTQVEGQHTDDRVAQARDRVLPYVVSILTVREDYQQGDARLNVSGGSGTLVTPHGHVVTNAHVTQNGKRFRVIFADQRERAARLVGEDTLSDIAVLKVEPVSGEQFPHAEFAHELTLRSGDPVLAMGAPWGYSQSLSMGVVNNPERLLASFFQDESDYESSLGPDQPSGRYYAWIQHDAAISPGNSGGPLVDLDGNVVGVNTRGSNFGGDMAFAIPAPEAMRIARQLIERGKVARSYLGFKLRSLHGTGYAKGALVYAVELGSPAARAGLQTGDRIVAVNGAPMDVQHPEQVPAAQRMLAELESGAAARLEVQRDGKLHTVSLTPEPYPADRGEDFEFHPFGLTLSPLTPAMARRRALDDARGLLITGVRPGGPAANLRPAPAVGDVLRQVAGKPVGARAELARWENGSAGKGEQVLIEFERRTEKRLALIEPRYGDTVRTPLPELPKPWAGVEVQPVAAPLARVLGLKESGGFRVTRVYEDGPLARAGVRVGDVLVALQDNALRPANETDSQSFHERVGELDGDAPVTFSGWRDGQAITLTATLGAAPLPAAAQRSSEIARLDAVVREMSFYDRVALHLPVERRGVMVEQVQSGSPAGLAHLQVGDAVFVVGGERVPDVAAFRAAFERALNGDARNISFEIQRGAESRLLFLDKSWLPEHP